MKKFLAIALVSLSSVSAFAVGADMYHVTLNCGPAVIHPDLGMSVQILEGGFSGIPQIKTVRFFLGHKQENTYMVRRLIDSRRVGSATVFQGKDVRFTINGTTTPNSDGSRPAVLETEEFGEEQLTCQYVR